MRPTALPSLALAVVLLAGGVAAARPVEDEGGRPPPGGSTASFSLSLATSGRGRLYEAHAGLGRFVLRDLSISLEGAGGLASFPDDAPQAHTWQAGLDLAPRWHFHRGVLGTLFADAGLGLRYFGRRFPQDGARFNYAFRAGLGLSVNATRTLGVAFGARFLHLSDVAASDGASAYDAAELHLDTLLAW